MQINEKNIQYASIAHSTRQPNYKKTFSHPLAEETRLFHRTVNEK